MSRAQRVIAAIVAVITPVLLIESYVRAAYAAMVAAGEPVTGTRLAAAAGVSASYGRALLAEFHANPAAAQPNGQQPHPRRVER